MKRMKQKRKISNETTTIQAQKRLWYTTKFNLVSSVLC